MQKRWTYVFDSCGYMLYFDGEPIRGVKTLGTATHTKDGRKRHWRQRMADRKMYRERAEAECAKLNELGIIPQNLNGR